MSSVHSAGSALAKITLQLHVFSFVLLQLTVTTEINGEKMSAVIKGNRKKYIWSLFTKNTRPLNYPRRKEKGFLGVIWQGQTFSSKHYKKTNNNNNNKIIITLRGCTVQDPTPPLCLNSTSHGEENTKGDATYTNEKKVWFFKKRWARKPSWNPVVKFKIEPDMLFLKGFWYFFVI